MKAPRHIIDHPAELDGLSVLPFRRRIGQRRVELSAALVPSGKRKNLEGELNRTLFACGCAEATLGLLAGLIGYGIWCFLPGEEAGTLRHAGTGLALACAGALTGKLLGLFAAERRLERIVAKVRAAIPARAFKTPKHRHEEPECG